MYNNRVIKGDIKLLKVTNEKVKILHILYESKGDYFGTGGVGTRAYEIYKYLKDRHDVTLLCKKYPGAKNREMEGLRHIFAGTESKSLTKTLLLYAYRAASFVRRHGEKFDIIIEEFSPAIPTFLHIFTRKPLVLQVQGYTGRLYFKKYNLVYALFLYFMEYLRPKFYKNFIFVNTETLRRVLSEDISSDRRDACPTSYIFPCISRSGVSPDLPVKRLLPDNPPTPPLVKGGEGGFFPLKTKKVIAIIPNGISPELLDTSPEDGDYILYLGRIDIYGKGLDILIKAYKEFYKSFPDIRLVIAGDGKDMEGFKSMLAELPEDVRKNLALTGWVSGDKKTEVIRKALFCVFPSRHEVQPISVLEAMACSKAVIVSQISGFDFVIQKGTGIAFAFEDPYSLSQTMQELMVSNKRQEMGLRGRNWVKEFTWERVASKYEEFINGVYRRHS